MSNHDGWVELEEGFFIVEESGSADSGRGMSEQADENYKRIKQAFEGNIEFPGEDESESNG